MKRSRNDDSNEKSDDKSDDESDSEIDDEIDHDKDEEKYQQRDKEWEWTMINSYGRDKSDGGVPFLLYPLRFFSYTLRFSDYPLGIWECYTAFPRYILHRLALLKVSILESSSLNISYRECKWRCFSEFSHRQYIDPQVANAASFLPPSVRTVDGQPVITTIKESSSESSDSTPSSPFTSANYRRRFQENRLILGLSRAPWSVIKGPSIIFTPKEEKLLQTADSTTVRGKGDHRSPAGSSESLESSYSASSSTTLMIAGNTIPSDSAPWSNSKKSTDHDSSSSSSSAASILRIPFSASLDSMDSEQLITMGLSYETQGCYHLSLSIWHLLLHRGHHYGYYKVGVRYFYGWNVRRCIDTAIYLFECSALASNTITPGLVYFLYTRHIDMFCYETTGSERVLLQCGLMIAYLVSGMIKTGTAGHTGPLRIKALGEVCCIPPPSDRFDADVLCLLMYLLYNGHAVSSIFLDSSQNEEPAIAGLNILRSSPRSHPISAFLLAVRVYGNSARKYYNIEHGIRCYKEASDGGLVEASARLGLIYELGYLDQNFFHDHVQQKKKLEFPIDLKQSCHYYQLALQRGDIDSDDRLQRVRKQL